MRARGLNRTITIIIVALFMITGCNNINDSTTTKQDYYELTQINETAYVFEEGVEYKYHYNSSEESEIIVELIISKNGEKIGKILLDDTHLEKKKTDGTFGITVNKIDEDLLLWTLMKDGEEAKIKTYDFLSSMLGTHGSVSEKGILCEEGTLVLQEEYNINNEENKDKTIYDISVNLSIYCNDNNSL